MVIPTNHSSPVRALQHFREEGLRHNSFLWFLQCISLHKQYFGLVPTDFSVLLCYSEESQKGSVRKLWWKLVCWMIYQVYQKLSSAKFLLWWHKILIVHVHHFSMFICSLHIGIRWMHDAPSATVLHDQRKRIIHHYFINVDDASWVILLERPKQTSDQCLEFAKWKWILRWLRGMKFFIFSFLGGGGWGVSSLGQDAHMQIIQHMGNSCLICELGIRSIQNSASVIWYITHVESFIGN